MNGCLACGKPVKNKFCNTSCQNKVQKDRFSNRKEASEKGIISRFGEFKEYKVNCEKCNKEIIVTEREKLFPKKEKYYCSRSCANTRIHSEETKKKTSNSIKKLIKEGNAPGYLAKYNNYVKPDKIVNSYVKKCKIANIYLKKDKPIIYKTCKKCGIEFNAKYDTQVFCSRKCGGSVNDGWKPMHNKMRNDPVWWSNIQKNLYSKGIQRVGGGTTKWLQYKDIKVQGTYELRACYILDKWKEEEKIKDWEYTKDRVPYIGVDNKPHTYLLDFKVYNNDGTFYYIETKGYIRENDELKWQAVRNQGIELKIWFKKELEELENNIKSLI